jgi:hypothetical protein
MNSTAALFSFCASRFKNVDHKRPPVKGRRDADHPQSEEFPLTSAGLA